MTDLADYLGAKYGGWFKLARAVRHEMGHQALDLDPDRRRRGTDGVSAVLGQAGGLRRAFPTISNGFLKLCQGLQKIGHPCGFSLGHALGDANGFASWVLWTHGAFLVDEKGKIAINSKETIDGAEIRHRAAEDDDPRHAVVERCRQQQGLRGGRRSA